MCLHIFFCDMILHQQVTGSQHFKGHSTSSPRVEYVYEETLRLIFLCFADRASQYIYLSN